MEGRKSYIAISKRSEGFCIGKTRNHSGKDVGYLRSMPETNTKCAPNFSVASTLEPRINVLPSSSKSSPEYFRTYAATNAKKAVSTPYGVA